jgi:hypothetical protein
MTELSVVRAEIKCHPVCSKRQYVTPVLYDGNKEDLHCFNNLKSPSNNTEDLHCDHSLKFLPTLVTVFCLTTICSLLVSYRKYWHNMLRKKQTRLLNISLRAQEGQHRNIHTHTQERSLCQKHFSSGKSFDEMKPLANNRVRWKSFVNDLCS